MLAHIQIEKNLKKEHGPPIMPEARHLTQTQRIREQRLVLQEMARVVEDRVELYFIVKRGGFFVSMVRPLPEC